MTTNKIINNKLINDTNNEKIVKINKKTNLEKFKNDYANKNLITFGFSFSQKFKENENKWKKQLYLPTKWQEFKLDNNVLEEKHNGLGMLTGKVNNIIVVDVDSIEDWKYLLEKTNQKEPDTVKAVSGGGGIHLFFKYDEKYKIVTSKDNAIFYDNKKLHIDVKTNGGFIIVNPSYYYNNNVKKFVSYKWEKSILKYEPSDLPEWIGNLLLEPHIIKDEKDMKDLKKSKDVKIKINKNTDTNEDDKNIYSYNEINELVMMLSENKSENYENWINVGMCLHNISNLYLQIWIDWSKKSKKYVTGECENKWKSFKKSKDGLKIGSLLLWCKNDNNEKYKEFIKRKKLNDLVISKFPEDNLILGDTINVSDICSYTNLCNDKCLIKGACHHNEKPSMYIETLQNYLTVKCRDLECFGKIYPCTHVHLTKQEMNIALNGDINITINNNSDIDDLVDFQKMDIYDNDELNTLVFNSLDGKSSSLAEIIFYYFKNSYNYGEDNNWYVFENHKWKNIGQKNSNLRYSIQPKLKEIYEQLLNYYKKNEADNKKIFAIKQIIKSFNDTVLKNNIITELIDLYLVNNNKNRDFVKSLDTNTYLIGFNNGVYDLKKFCFRDGHPTDNITMSVNYNYNDKYTDKYIDLQNFLNDIQPNKEDFDYAMTYFSIGLVGNTLELFTILSGSGRNGKSKLIELIKDTFGDYFGSVGSQLFTRPRPNADSPDPGLLNLAKKKIVIASEPEKNSKLNSGFIKFITGRDSTTLRNCHQNEMIDFSPKFITFLLCNDIPDCDDIDNAFTKRLRCINFPTEFVDNPTKENQKKINVDINENFKYWKMDFMLMLIECYKKYIVNHSLKATNNILKWTNQYKENTDMYLTYLNENTEENSDGHIHCSNLYTVFKDWFKENNPNTKIPNNKEFVNGIKRYKTVEKLRVNDKVQLGIKNLKLNDD